MFICVGVFVRSFVSGFSHVHFAVAAESKRALYRRQHPRRLPKPGVECLAVRAHDSQIALVLLRYLLRGSSITRPVRANRGNSLLRKRPLLGPYYIPMPRALWCCHKTVRCRRVIYPESYITKHTTFTLIIDHKTIMPTQLLGVWKEKELGKNY